MNLNIDCCFFVMENIENENKRKNDTKSLKLLVDENNDLLSIKFDGKSDIKKLIRNKIKSVIGSDLFHLEQVYTLGDEKFNENGVSVIYLGITNKENITYLHDNCKLISFDIVDKKKIILDNQTIEYSSVIKKENNNIEFFHEIKTNDVNLEKKAVELITSYKQILSKIGYTDIMFKFLPRFFTLEDVRIVYEMITKTTVDKSNFRKKIMHYCKATDKVISNKGYRPTQVYEFVLDENDIWI